MHGNITSDLHFTNPHYRRSGLIKKIVSVARTFGYLGDPYADSVPNCGSEIQQRAIVAIAVKCGPDCHPNDRDFALGIVKRCVLLHNDINDKNDVFKPENSCEARTFSAVELENRSHYKQKRGRRRG